MRKRPKKLIFGLDTAVGLILLTVAALTAVATKGEFIVIVGPSAPQERKTVQRKH
jgi:hypothetical protein